MRNKQLVLKRLQKLNGLLRKLDMNIHRGGTRTETNQTQNEINHLLQDIRDIEKQNKSYEIISRTNPRKLDCI